MPTYPPTSEPTTSAASPITASLVPAIPVPTHGAGGTFAVLAKTRISAPPQEVLSLIRNTKTWPLWNTFCPSCAISPKSPPVPVEPRDDGIETGKEGWLEVGTVAVVDVFMNGDGLVSGKKRSREQGVVVTILERFEEEGKRGLRIAWKSTGWAHWQMHSERVMEFVETGDRGTEYSCWETFGGVLGSVVKRMVGEQLVDRFGDYARDVKVFVEGGKEKENGVVNGNT
jgi:hypothetical protein